MPDHACPAASGPAATQPAPRPVRFVHRGTVQSVSGLPATTTVLGWLREQQRCTGTKEGCNEGDCGACTVLVGELDAEGAVRFKPVNSCIQWLPALDGKALLTVEDLGAPAAPHPVQQAMVACHGSQCGFCTPGFVMSLAGTAERCAATGQVPSRAQIADDLSGNLCRCTGYRPILDAGEQALASPAALPRLASPELTQQLRALQADAPLHLPGDGALSPAFHAPKALAELAALRAAHPEATLLAGCTDIGLWLNKQFRRFERVIALGGVAELQVIELRAGQLHIGAGASLQAAWEALAQHWPATTEMGRRFASRPVREAGTLGGNIANGSPIGDGAPVLMALSATLHLRLGAATRTLPLATFYLGYMKNALQPGEFVEAIQVPLPLPGDTLRAWKLSKRFDCDISALACGLHLRLDGDTVAEARFAFGGMAATVRRAAQAEAAVIGQPWTEATARAAMAALAQDFQPLTDLRASAAHRQRAAANLLWRLWLETRPIDPLPASATSPTPRSACGASPPGERPQRPGEAGSAAAAGLGLPAASALTLGEMGHARPHESAHLHVAGAAPYTDDLPEPAGTLHAALGLSPLAHGRITGIDLERLRAQPGVVAVLTALDIPGPNDCGAIVRDDPILAELTRSADGALDGTVRHVGQPVFAVIARTRGAARRAAALAPQVLTITPLPAVLGALAAHANQQHVVPPMHLTRGDAPAALAQATQLQQGQFSLGGQEQFYLEGQISLAVPQEDGGMRMHCSTQHPSEMQHAVAQALGVAAHRVQVVCRRMGGGFGGKESQSALFACVAAVAAARLQRPVKLRPDRDDDFAITGRRHPFEFDWRVAHDDAGRITAAEVTMVSNAGHSADLSAPVMTRALCHFDNAYWLPHVAAHGYCARTNTQSNTAFRGFGGPQGALAIELVIDDIARSLGMDALDVRRANFYGTRSNNITPYGQVVRDNLIAPLVEQLAADCAYAERRASIAAFNAASPVLKKGLALTPVKFGIAFNVAHFNQAGALVHVYTDGSVLVNHGGTEMGQGLNTKVAQVVALTLGVPFEAVRCSATDTAKIANTSATAASTGSDLNGKAAEDAARQIRARLAAFAAQRHGGNAEAVVFADGQVEVAGQRIPWAELVQAAYVARVQLWSDGHYATPGLHWNRDTLQGEPFQYFAYGAACSEVIVDTLTGEHRVLRADLLHDVGASLNPAIDIGQIEGAYIQGLGWLTMEELWWQPMDGSRNAGRLMTHAPSTYKIPTANDVPAVFNTRLYGQPNAADTIGKSKAVGEPPLLLAFSAFLAIRDAISAAGGHCMNPPLRAPATPEAVLDALVAVTAGAAA